MILVVQEWLPLQVDGELSDWPLIAPHTNAIENMWSEVKNGMHKSYFSSSRETVMFSGPLGQTPGKTTLSPSVMILSLTEYMPR